ncbi:MAG TPA: hypothetical protein VN706_11785 [Gemmatimonadaceae bacterium]|nr:hypothetical protein [Gemmatimonadaceae bacterium]
MRLLILVIVLTASAADAQAPPQIRQIGVLEHMTPTSMVLASVTNALAMPGGRVLINDTRGRRVLLLDSTLSRATVVADSTDATANTYSYSWSTLVRYRGDTALLMVPSSLSMFIITPAGVLGRIMAMPRPEEAPMLAASWGGVSAFDPRGRLVYFGGRGVLGGVLTLRTGMPLVENGKLTEVGAMLNHNMPDFLRPDGVRLDSSVIVRVDPQTRGLDTLAWLHIPKFRRQIKLDETGSASAIETTPDPMPIIDQWILLRDGTLAVVRGRDFHIDWLDPSGHWSSSPKIPFDWQHVDDARKRQLIDSAVAQRQDQYERVAGGRGSGAGRGGVAGRYPSPTPNIAVRPGLAEVADYAPAFGEHSVESDEDGNLWIRTTQIADGRPVYDVVNRRGVVIDRVQLPRFRSVAGFGPGVIYMAVIDPNGVVRLERARLR